MTKWDPFRFESGMMAQHREQRERSVHFGRSMAARAGWETRRRRAQEDQEDYEDWLLHRERQARPYLLTDHSRSRRYAERAVKEGCGRIYTEFFVRLGGEQTYFEYVHPVASPVPAVVQERQ